MLWQLRLIMLLLQAALIGQMEWNVRQVLAHDTSAISTYRCLKIFLERLGCNFADQVHLLPSCWLMLCP